MDCGKCAKPLAGGGCEGGNGIGKPTRSPSIRQQLEGEIRFFVLKALHAGKSAEDMFPIIRNIFAIGGM